MLLGQRLRGLRKAQNLSLGDIQKRIGLLRTYVSRVECGRTIPTLDTLEKLAYALNLPLYRLFVDDPKPREDSQPKLITRQRNGVSEPMRQFLRFRRMLPRLSEADRDLLLATALQMARMSPR